MEYLILSAILISDSFLELIEYKLLGFLFLLGVGCVGFLASVLKLW